MIYINDSSRVWHVAKVGNDGNSGHAGQYPVNLANDAKLTIGAAVSAAASGDTIIIWPGTYSETIDASSTGANKALAIIGTHRQLCKITYPSGYNATLKIGSNTVVRNLTIEAANPNKAVESGSASTNLVFENCDIIGTYDGLYIYGATRVTVKDCRLKGTYDGGNMGECYDVLCERVIFETDGAYSGSGDYRGIHVGKGRFVFRDCVFTGTQPSRAGSCGGLDLNSGTSAIPTLVVCENCIMTASGSSTNGYIFGVRVQNYGRLVLKNCSIFTTAGAGTATDIRQTGSGQVIVNACAYNPSTVTGTITNQDSNWASAMAVALFTNGAANKLKIDAVGRVDAGSVEGINAESLQKVAKMLLNKAVQDKLTGAIRYYDDDGQTVILTHTPSEDGTSVTRTVS